MKKTKILLFLVLLVFTLAGCQDENELPGDLPQFTFQLVNSESVLLVDKDISFDPEVEKTTVEWIEAVVPLDYDVYDIGVLVNGIDGHYPKEYGASYNYFYSLYVDGEESWTGLGDVVLTDGLEIKFVETSTLSEFDQTVDQFIYDFIASDALDSYINAEQMNYLVLAAIHQLNTRNYLELDLTPYYLYDDLALTTKPLAEQTIGELIRFGVYTGVEGLDLTSYQTHLLALDLPSNPYSLSTYLEALTLSGKQNEAAAQTLIETTINDSDLLGMILSATYGYNNLDDFLDDAKTYIQANSGVSGMKFMNSYSSESTATIIMGLIAHGLNPEDETFQTDGIGLIEALMTFKEGNGFKSRLTDENADFNFATPQAFAALVQYKIARDIWGFPPTHLFAFN